MVHTPSAPSTLLQPHLSCPLLHLLQPCLLSSMPTPTYAHATAHNCATPMYDWIIVGSMSDPCGPGSHPQKAQLNTSYEFVGSLLIDIDRNPPLSVLTILLPTNKYIKPC